MYCLHGRRLDHNRPNGRLVTWYCDTVAYLALVVLCLMGPSGLRIAEAQGVRGAAVGRAVEPGRLPRSFMATETLTKLRGLICKSCPKSGRGKQRLCSDFSPKDVCHTLCGCSNLRQRCLDNGECTCPLTIDEGCRGPGSTEVCEFDDAVVCSTARDVCLYYDEKKMHCDCQGGWTGENCQTCSNILSDCDQPQGEKPPGGPTTSGLDFTFKALIVACVAFVTVALLLAVVICLCRSGRLVCVTMSRVEKNNETEDKTKGMTCNQSVPARQPQSQHQYYHIAQYAVPESLSSASTPSSPRNDAAGYAEPNARRPRQPVSQADREDSNYYYKLEPTSSAIVTYESVAHRVEDRVCPARPAGAIAVVSGDRPCDDPRASAGGPVLVTAVSPVADARPDFGTRLSTTKPNHSGGVYDRLKRNMDISSDTASNYSHISLHGDL